MVIFLGKEVFHIGNQNGTIPNIQIIDEVIAELTNLRSKGQTYIDEYNTRCQLETELEQRKQLHESYPASEGHIYFLRYGDRVKIGKSINYLGRIQQLKTGFADLNKAKLLFAFPSNNITADEMFFHAKFKSKHLQGEWFNLDDSDICEVKNILEAINDTKE
jgi:hypothetical protein